MKNGEGFRASGAHGAQGRDDTWKNEGWIRG